MQTKHQYIKNYLKISLKGAKAINFNTYADNRIRVSIVLTIECNEYKFPALLIFKGGKGKNQKIDLINMSYARKKNIYKISTEIML